MSGLRVEPFAGTAAEWDAAAAALPGGTFSHRFGWKRVIEDAYRQRCIYLAARGDDDEIAGILPLVLVRGMGFGRFLVSMPYLNAGGPAGDADAAGALTAAAETLAAELHADTVELRCAADAGSALPAARDKVTCVLDLPAGGPDALWKGFGSKLRSQVKRAEREGVEMRFGPEQAEPFFAVFSRHMRDLGTPTHPWSFFRAVRDEMGADAWFGCAWLDGRPVAGGCALAWADSVEMTWASSLREAARCAPNMLLYWSFLRRAADAGLASFDFGRCTPGGPTHAFKRQWGTRDVPLPWVRRVRTPGAAAPSADRGAFALGTRLWKHLPVPVATLIGPALRRAIPA
ncbi:MAG TPA: FemAB family XrtA/PEP-CTERM system-associated protein [Longimicrobiaceae bacterium]|jgi:FemAB-related protein (PEP-CTERM system-associated)|nr:FemAB family XrtA/PEP-CTERM system-associated protein [Longimicrobiaceae bacterium]